MREPRQPVSVILTLAALLLASLAFGGPARQVAAGAGSRPASIEESLLKPPTFLQNENMFKV